MLKRNKEIQKELFLKYLEYIKNIKLYKKEKRIKNQAMYFFKGIDGVKKLRIDIQSLKKTEEVIEKVKKF
jgi:hypothetical protein